MSIIAIELDGFQHQFFYNDLIGKFVRYQKLKEISTNVVCVRHKIISDIKIK